MANEVVDSDASNNNNYRHQYVVKFAQFDVSIHSKATTYLKLSIVTLDFNFFFLNLYKG